MHSLNPTGHFCAIIFDCDGTLADTLEVHFEAWAAALRTLDIEMTRSWYFERSGLSAAEMIEELEMVHARTVRGATFMDARRQCYRRMTPNIRAIDSVVNIARAYAQRVPMAVASGGDRAMVEPTLAGLQLLPLFKAVVTVDEVQRGKPSPELFLLAAQRLNVAPENCLVYEDSSEGLEAARRANMRSIDVRRCVRPGERSCA